MKIHPLEAMTECYLKEKNLSDRTTKDYRIAFKYFINYLKEQGIMYAKRSDVFRYREYRRMLGHSSHYIYVHISALKGLYKYLRINQQKLGLPEIYRHDVMAEVKNERIKQGIKKPILTIQQAKQLILRTRKVRKYLWHYRDHAIIYLMLTSGLRRIEIVHARISDYQEKEGKRVLYVRYGREKGEEDYVKIASGARKAIDDYLKKRDDDNPYLFVSHKKVSKDCRLSRTFFRYMFRRVLRTCGLEGEGITPHCLRHTAAAMNLLRGGSISQTKTLMRHKSVQSTLVYSDYISRMKDDSEAQIESFILKEEAYNDYLDLLQDLFE